MKRLIKKAFEKTLYHGTTLDKLEGISNSGMMLPNETSGAGNGGDPNGFDGFTFFATDMWTAKQYAFEWGGRSQYPKVVLEVNVPESALLPDDNDEEGAKTWQESADLIGQVKVLGSITSDYFRKVYFFNSEQEKVAEANFSNWQDVFNQNMNKIYDDNVIDVQIIANKKA